MELRPFGTLTIETDPEGLYILGVTSGTQRIIQEFLSVRFEGERCGDHDRQGGGRLVDGG